MENRLIGNSSFDDDFLYVELFVDHSKNPFDEELNLKLYYYYLIHSFIYKQYALGILNEKEEFLVKFNEYVKIFDDNFKANKLINMDHVLELFLMIGKFLCNDSNNSLSKNKIENFYLLCNGKSNFGINSYLYAYFENVYVASMPTHNIKTDSILYCPLFYYGYDMNCINNTIQLASQKEKFEELKKIYKNIINDNEIDTKYKELLLSIIFIIVHEFNTFFEFGEDMNLINLHKIWNENNGVSRELIKNGLLNKYAYLIREDDYNNFSQFIYEFEDAQDDKEILNYLVLMNMGLNHIFNFKKINQL